GRSNLDDDFADVTLAVETIEHLENPRAFLRELTRVTKPGGCVIVTTPNQLSLLSLLSLVVKGHYAAFLDPCYPAHITALLETDLRRIATECGLQVLGFRFSHNGRIPGSGLSWPPLLSKLSPRRFSDNLLLLAQKP
ncbi:MAG: methyltransferase domain-containing protein, partial [Bryobacteraceae bacterium]|nr:methyltransferase domain-containing protein [Bryobacteraceae bacterium]